MHLEQLGGLVVKAGQMQVAPDPEQFAAKEHQPRKPSGGGVNYTAQVNDDRSSAAGRSTIGQTAGFFVRQANGRREDH